MKPTFKILTTLILTVVICSLGFGREYPPGGGPGEAWVHYQYQVHVTNPSGSPVSNIEVRMTANYQLWQGGQPVPYLAVETGSTNSSGNVTLEKWVEVTGYWPNNYYFSNMYVEMIDPNYTILSTQGDYSNYPTASANFEVVYDLDGDSLDDNLELQLANKFSPDLHKHSWDLQQGLSNVDWILNGRATLKAVNSLGQSVYNSTISNPSQIHVHLGTGDRDSFGKGEMWTFWMLDINDTYRHQGAPAGQRPVYYHVYKEGSYYYVQYWYFFTMNDIINQTVNDTWHEGDFEHVSIKVNSSYDPVAVNFYRHEGGRTVSPANCWWSSTNSSSYSQIQQGYSSSRTHLHIWIAANSHASYNRYQEVNSTTASGTMGDFCISLDPEYYIDNVDYDPSGYNLYFEYDYLENLGEYEQSPLQQASNGYYYPYAHGSFWFEHNIPRKFSKSWLTFIGRFGQFWTQVCGPIPFGSSTASPLSPAFGQDHEWKNFTENYSIYGFGNQLEYNPFVVVGIIFTNDPSDGD